MDIQSILNKYKNVSNNFIYDNKKLSITGIDYDHYIKMDYNLNIANVGADSWYLLWYLLSHINTKNSEYLQINTAEITLDIGWKLNKIKENLYNLCKLELIYVDLDTIKTNNTVKIVILYAKESISYKAIPSDYIRAFIIHLQPVEWSIYTIIYLYHRTYKIKANNDLKTCIDIEYSFPTIRNMEDILKISKSTVNRYIKSLANNKYNLISVVNGKYNHEHKKMGNNIYKVHILDRFEYIHNRYLTDININNIDVVMKSISWNDIVNNELENKNKEYYLVKYGIYLKQYLRILEDKDFKSYHANKTQFSTSQYS